jgi:hypothetical protein
MTSRIAQRRGAKASRRKKLLAERRKRDPAPRRPSLAQFASAPLCACLLQDGLFERGNGTLILARHAGPGRVATAAFLLDVFCLGVKDVILRIDDEAEVEIAIEALGYEAPLVEVDPSYARKLLRDAVAYARSLGLEPHPDYAAAERLFGDSAADACDVGFSFGLGGRPLYMPGPSDTPAKIRQRIAALKRHVGEDGFDLAWPDDALEDLGSLVYDPAAAPDPADWLALDEDERLAAVLVQHRLTGVPLPNEDVHAALHVVIETQIAEGEPRVCRAIERLVAAGLDRHDAIHAVGSVLVRHLNDRAAAGTAGTASTEGYLAAVDRLTAESWYRDFAAPEG